ncbi:MAG: hypothetical protein M1831_005799 [Alyxoria varia]|nr:MAG: hypothetical protein M1831_005799 [Alyxoria varia]
MLVRAIGRVVAADARQKAASFLLQRPSLLIPLLDRVSTLSHNRFNSCDGLINHARTYATAKRTTTRTKEKTTDSGSTKKTRKTTKTKTKGNAKKPAKKPAKKSAKKPAKKPKRARKEPTPEQKLRAKVNSLKRAALLDQPKHLPETTMRIIMKEGTERNVADRSRAASQKYRSLSPAEQEHYKQVCSQNKEANKHATKRFVESHTPDEIRLANNARRQLNNVRRGDKLAGQKQSTVGKIYAKLEDPRVSKRPTSTWATFLTQRFASGDYKGLRAPEASKYIKRDWENLSREERKVRSRGSNFVAGALIQKLANLINLRSVRQRLNDDYDILRQAHKEQQRRVFPNMKVK